MVPGPQQLIDRACQWRQTMMEEGASSTPGRNVHSDSIHLQDKHQGLSHTSPTKLAEMWREIENKRAVETGIPKLDLSTGLNTAETAWHRLAAR